MKSESFPNGFEWLNSLRFEHGYEDGNLPVYYVFDGNTKIAHVVIDNNYGKNKVVNIILQTNIGSFINRSDLDKYIAQKLDSVL